MKIKWKRFHISLKYYTTFLSKREEEFKDAGGEKSAAFQRDLAGCTKSKRSI